MKKRKLWIALMILAAAFLFFFIIISNQKKQDIRQGNLLINGDFSSIDDQGLPDGWYTDDYMHTAGYTEFSAEKGIVTIVNHALNDARFAQSVAVQPDSFYLLSGEIMAEAEGGLGANLSVSDVYAFSESVYDTQGKWQTIRFYGRTGKNQHQVTVFVRLGGYSGEAVGTASFRNISLETVQSVPSDSVAAQWYKEESRAADDLQPFGNSAWPYLLTVACLFAVACYMLGARIKANSPKADNRNHQWIPVISVLLIGLVSRILIARMIPGYGVDIGCFTYWGQAMAQNGAAAFYNSAGFCDYPPGYILILGMLAKLGNAIGCGMTEMLVKIPSVICDIAAAAVIYSFAARSFSHKTSLVIAALYCFNPLTFAAGAAWGQADSVMAFVLLLVVILAMKDRWEWALPLYMLAVLLKPQALMFGPIGLLACIYTLFKKKNKTLNIRCAVGVVLAIVTGLAIILPFSPNMDNSDGWWLIRLYSGTMGYYANATVNACNLYFLFGKNWAEISLPAEWYIKLLCMALLFSGVFYISVRRRHTDYAFNRIMSAAATALILAASLIYMTYGTLGTVVIIFALVLCGCCYIRGGDIRHLPLIGAVLLILLCDLGVMMHERYLFPAVVLLAVACLTEKDKRVYFLFVIVSVSAFLNVALVLDRGIRIGGSAGHLSAPMFGIESDSALLEYAVSGIQCLTVICAGCVTADICILGRNVGWAESFTADLEMNTEEDLRNCISEEEAKLIQPMKGIDWLLMIGITALYAAVALTDLGAVRSPQTWWRSNSSNEYVILDLGQTRHAHMLYLGGIHNRDQEFTVQISDDAANWSDPYWGQITEGDCFKWKYLTAVMEYDGSRNYSTAPEDLIGRYIKLSAKNISLTLYEVILRDPDTQNVYPVSLYSGSGENLIDEQDMLKGEPGWYNSTYFDEIYHARTGYEHYLAMKGDYTYYPYETSHPPLGKVLMAFSIGLFGMTPFGWRFAGAFAGILMLPGMYLLGKMLTKRRSGAVLSICLMALDFMHYTQTRIATIDSFVVLFIIWSYVFMIRYIRMDYWNTSVGRTLIPLGLSGLFMGLAIASKWTGCYAGVGLAILFFSSLFRRFRQANEARLHSDRIFRNTREITAANDIWKRPVITLLSCLIFFIAIPLCVYYISYIPYFLPYTPSGVTVKRVIQAAVGDYFETGFKGGMLGYHSTPGLGMDHPFYSPWYEWPLIIKPMWYYADTYREPGFAHTIVAFGNPAVWWSGLAAIVISALLWLSGIFKKYSCKKKTMSINDSRPYILTISFAAQFIPWTLVPRGTYIYHYFTCVPFIIICISFLLDLLADKASKVIPLPFNPFRRIKRSVCSILNKELKGTSASEKDVFVVNMSVLPMILNILLLAASLALFIAFFPYISGARAPVSWLKAMQWFKGWIYY